MRIVDTILDFFLEPVILVAEGWFIEKYLPLVSPPLTFGYETLWKHFASRSHSKAQHKEMAMKIQARAQQIRAKTYLSQLLILLFIFKPRKLSEKIENGNFLTRTTVHV